MILDEKDKQLLALLQLNARISVADLARQIHLARSTVQERLKRLENTGVISGYSVRLGDNFRSQSGIQSSVSLSVKAPYLNKTIKTLENILEVQTCSTVSGVFDLMLEVHCDSPNHLDEVVERIGALNGVERTDSSIILRSFFTRNPST